MRLNVAALALAFAVGGCSGLPDSQAIALVKRYNERVIEAYRIGDPRIVEEVCGDAEATKLAGLIGVKGDLGYTLDANLLELTATSVKNERGVVVVRTRERWGYRDRKIGTGEQVGEESTDTYAMEYRLGRREKRWVVMEIVFSEPPQVGRRAGSISGDPRDFHGMPPANAGAPR